MLDLYLLKYFLAVVEAGSFTKAAEQCYVTQPTLSTGIKKLEEQLGHQLFERTRKRVFVTEAGARFLPRARAIFNECNMAVQDMTAQEDAPLLRLGILSTVSGDLIRRLLSAFKQECPAVILEIEDGSEQELRNRLADRALDFVISVERGEHDSQRSTTLLEEDYLFAVSSDQSFPKGAVFTGAGLSDTPMVVRSRCEVLSETSRYFTDRNIRPRLVYRTPNDVRALEMVAAGIGGTLAPRSTIGPIDGLQARPLKGFDYRRTIVLMHPIHRLGEQNIPVAKVFQETAEAVFSASVPS